MALLYYLFIFYFYYWPLFFIIIIISVVVVVLLLCCMCVKTSSLHVKIHFGVYQANERHSRTDDELRTSKHGANNDINGTDAVHCRC